MQTITLRNRVYTFVPGHDAELDGHDNHHIGELQNSRGEFAGWIFEMNSNGSRLLMGGPQGISRREERAALATLEA